MNRRAFVTGLGAVLAAPSTPRAAEAQRTGKVYTIGILSSATPSPTYGPILFNALRDLGYELGRNLIIELRYAAGRVELLPNLVGDLLERPTDIIIALGASESLAAAKATSTTPIVFLSPASVELGLVRSLARPGGNITGVSVE
jgi:putative tryptophan/tyrosine transport system substrate-binding protein